MANTKKTTTKETENVNKQNESSQDLSQILEMVQKMQEQINTLVDENTRLKEEQEKQKLEQSQTAIIEESIAVEPIMYEPIVSNTNNKIKIYHMQEMIGGLETYIKLTDTQRSLRKMGQVCTFTHEQFEELEGKYRHFFDKGIIALGAEHMDLAELYDLPIYDSKTKSQYNSDILKKVTNYNYDQLSNFYNNLSKNNQNAFLQYWLGKVYDKEEGYYDVEKMHWLETISGTRSFSPIIIEIENNNRRNYNTTINADK